MTASASSAANHVSGLSGKTWCRVSRSVGTSDFATLLIDFTAISVCCAFWSSFTTA
jgi:hypothetical protein